MNNRGYCFLTHRQKYLSDIIKIKGIEMKFWLIGLLVIFSSVGSYATSEDRLGFALNSVKLLKKTWYSGDANLKVLILYENNEGTASKVEVIDNKNAPLNQTISLKYNLGAYIPINGNSVDINIVFLNENDNIELAGFVLSAMKNIAKRKTIKNIKKLSNWNWMSAIAKEVIFGLGADYTEKKIIEYLKENEIERVNLNITRWNDEQTITRGNVKISYETRFSGVNHDNKWKNPSKKACLLNGGERHGNSICKANWENAKRICNFSYRRLANIKELEKVAIECGSDRGDKMSDPEEKNIKNISYQNCYKAKGFRGGKSDNYWSNTYTNSTRPLKSFAMSMDFYQGATIYSRQINKCNVLCLDKK